MQTFLPYSTYRPSAKVLDTRRLGNQRVEVLQIVTTIRFGGGWQHHPAVKMWRPYVNSLIDYGLTICEEWVVRGYKDTVSEALLDLREDKPITHPLWLGSVKFHASHRSNLLRKDPGHYGQFGWKEPPDLPYVWPNPWQSWRQG